LRDGRPGHAWRVAREYFLARSPTGILRHDEEAMRRMKSVQSHPSAALLGVANKPPLTWELPQPKRPIALKVATLLDGKGGTLRDTVVGVCGGNSGRTRGPVPQGAQVYDLGGMTVAPGLIDTHVHVTYHFSHERFIDNRLVRQGETGPRPGPSG